MIHMSVFTKDRDEPVLVHASATAIPRVGERIIRDGNKGNAKALRVLNVTWRYGVDEASGHASLDVVIVEAEEVPYG